MATKDLDSSDIKKQEELEDITTCCICTEVFTDPKGLPCMHTFCMKCIQETGLKTNKGPGDDMPCPICRQQFKIPPVGFSGLPKNIFIERLIGLRETSVPDSPAVAKALCSACLEENQEQDSKGIPAADTYCVECKHKLCEGCSSDHRKFKLTRNHKLIPINEYESTKNAKTNLPPGVCELHRQRVLDVYCTDCKTVVCAMCFIKDHNKHAGEDVDNIVHDFRKQIESHTEAINDCKAKAQTKKAELLDVREEIQRSVEKLEGDVNNRADELIELIDKHKAILLQDLRTIKESKLKDTQITTDDIATYLSCLETYNSYSQKMLAKGSASDICGAFSNLSIRMIELQEQCQAMIERETQSFNTCFRKSELDEFLEYGGCDNFIGDIQEKMTKSSNLEEKLKHELNKNERLMKMLAHKKQRLLAELRYVLDPVLVNMIRANSGKQKTSWFGTESKDIRGMTILDKELFVVIEKSSEVEVYDSMKSDFRRRWNLKELFDPTDIASCSINKCLYIFDLKDIGQRKEILKVDSKGNLLTKWSGGDDFVWGMSVTDESNVILTVYDRNKLLEYSPDGKLIREISLPSDAGVRHPWHSMKLANGDFMVCQGSKSDDRHRVCLVDADGKLKKSSGDMRGSTIEQLHCPIHLSVDANGFVMVADRENIRVLQLDSDLKFQREIVSKEEHGLRHPARILLDESNGRLFVADNESNNRQILIFAFI